MERLRERLKDALKEQNLRRANVEELNKKITKYEEINKLFRSLEKIRQTGKELEARQAESKERRQQIENARKADKVLVAEQQKSQTAAGSGAVGTGDRKNDRNTGKRSGDVRDH